MSAMFKHAYGIYAFTLIKRAADELILDCWSSRRMDSVWNGLVNCIHSSEDRFTKDSFFNEPILLKIQSNWFASHLRDVFV